MTIEVLLPDEAATDRAGAALAGALGAGDAVLLFGDLGAGKSALARAAIRALLAEDGREDEDIPSPSFALVQVYDAPRAEIWHADLHRLSGPEGCVELGLEDAFEGALCFVEWPERLGPLTPARRLELRLDFGPEGRGRLLRAAAVGPGWERAMAALAGLGAGCGGKA
ncbi:tRNA (adenosine(37)-N6)-threonylcarbamoyltransferase complex ATPase subunit type 1 TsaE [Oceanicella actignis]|uniref:tRNA (adenosine(37)-N6)-threonylcarbamoyltransferase complex ATPase subunit type 1 TsaE n=1 Tax=Oceanicella actignis TaxID=1189325 RepID=UPI0011E67FD2|nr:tRNA (adenosine(37)-N6)-threonylcarbamoyltransferase complex ATPase subunit type 1 TsaE [Oceanicella actignis]TYO84805.1 tRNA threonylcarbamoyladenosine biosynthesis protein TsaE [Oceanicella actignis]